jgi:hypothetical protein
METYRVICVYEPTYRHLAGSERNYWHFKRGAWRVAGVWDVSDVTNPFKIVTHGSRALGVLSIRKPQIGTRVNPKKLLEEYARMQQINAEADRQWTEFQQFRMRGYDHDA